MSVEYTIVCDECATVLDASGVSAAKARRLLRSQGCRVALPGGRDYCAQCAVASVAQPDKETNS